ncbi:hypothetical protein AAHE18_13G167400 [Arachis hypogaea]
MESAPTFLLILFFIIPLFIKLLKHTDSSNKSKPSLPPGPKPWPIVGNLPEMLANKPTFRWIQNIMNDLDTEIACIRVGNIHVIPVSSPSIAREFLMKQDAIFASRPLNWSSKYVSSGYLTTSVTPCGEQWKKMKRIFVEELLSPQRHQWMHDKRAEEADNLVRYVYNQTKNGGGLVDLRHVGQHFGGNLSRRMLFNKRYFGKGREDGGPGPEELEHVVALFVVELTVGTMDNPFNNVEWVFSEMINQPKILQKATQELDRVVGNQRLVQESDIPKLNYVKACLREGFRLHPIVDFNVPHVSTEDTIVANYFIPKGSHVLIRRQGVGQNPRVWEEPLKFKPERHLKRDGCDLTLTEPSLELFTFGAGRRSCPAITLGTYVTVMLFARLVHGFTWIAPPNEPIIDLSELERDTSKAKPLVAFGKPRLPAEVYHPKNYKKYI